MKLGLILASAIFAFSGLSPDASLNNAGGSILFEFNETSEIDNFQMFSEYGNDPYILDGRLYTNVMAEQKIIFGEYNFSNVIVETEVKAINPLGKIDAGIYFDASLAKDALDGIDAYCLNIEHDVNELTYKLKLHHFKEGVYVGSLAESDDIKYIGNSVKLKLVIEDDEVKAYTDGKTELRFTYNLEGIDQKVGLRGYYSPSYFEYFKVTAETFEKDLNEFDAELQRARAINLEQYTANSSLLLKECLEDLDTIDLKSLNQLEIDELCERLRNCIETLVEKHSLSELNQLVLNAQTYIDEEDKYTLNSIESVKYCVGEAQKISVDDEDIVSYWYNMLAYRISVLVRYAQ